MTELWKLAVTGSHFRLTRVLKLRRAQGVTAISHNSGIKSKLGPSYEVLLLVAHTFRLTYPLKINSSIFELQVMKIVENPP